MRRCAAGLRKTTAELFVMVDDDATPKRDFVERHIGVVRRFDADVSVGQEVSEDTPNPRKVAPEGHRLIKVADGNVGIRRWIPQHVQFCPEANLTGGQDHEFFLEAANLGAKLVSAQTAQSVSLVRQMPPQHRYESMCAEARNRVYRYRVRRGILSAIQRYSRKYALRGINGVLLACMAFITGSERHRTLARKLVSMHRFAIQGFYRPGLDREEAKRGRLVEVA